MKPKVTIYDIAKEAGVSTATVSRVINGTKKVSPKTEQKITFLLKKYHFVPNAIAQNLRKTQSKTIGIITSDLRNPFFSNLLIECEKIASLNGYTIIACDSLESEEMEREHLLKLDSQKVDAIIQIGGSSEKSKKDKEYEQCIRDITGRIPLVTTGYAEFPNCYSVMTDEAEAMEILLNYLLDLGHSKIAFLGGNIEIRSTEEKYKRYESLLAKRGMKYRRYIESPYTKEGGYRAVETLLEDAEIPTAVIMINEMAAVGAFKAFHEKGIGIPHDVSMVCFDNTYISAIMRPALTTVGCNYECFGEKLVYTALDAMENHVPFKTTYVESVFVKRDSAISRELT